MTKSRKSVKRKTTHHKRHGRIGAVKENGIMDMGMKLAGVVVGSAGFTAIQHNLTTVNNKVVGLIGAIGGMMLVDHAQRSGHGLVEGIGWGISGGGAISFSHDIGLIHGIDDALSGLSRNHDIENGYEMKGLYDGNMVTGISNGSHVGGISNGSHVGGDFDMAQDVMPIGA
jgi:hypothetical protein